MRARAAESATFLSALARRIDARLVVYVPANRRARGFWFVPTGAAAEVEALEAIGRAVLAADTARLRDWTADRSGEFTADRQVAISLVGAPDDSLAGVLLAAKDAGHQWSRAEHALLDFTSDFYVPQLLSCASRPLPAPMSYWPPLSARGRRTDTADLESGMRSAPGRGELFLLYQPEIDLTSGCAIGVEALTRWLHPRLGELGPDSFIALAEHSDLIQVLGTWLIEESFRDFGSWLQELPGLSAVLRVNVSPVQLASPGIADQFAAALDRHGLRGEHVCIELTENREVPNPDTVAAALAELHKLGVGSAIDDLASGFSTLTRLRAFDVDLVKLDRGLVHGIDSDARARTIVHSLVGLAADLGVGVIAEGVETAAEAETLLTLGCASAQGHYFARPMTSADTLAFLRARGRWARPAADDGNHSQA